MSAELKIVESGNTFLALKDGVVAGKAMLCVYAGIFTFRKGWVKPVFRGQGIHGKLIRQRLARARLSGATQVVAWVQPSNHASLNNLVQEGFLFAGKKPKKFDGKLHVCLSHELPLTSLVISI